MKLPRLNPRQIKGVSAALFSAVILGLPPIFVSHGTGDQILPTDRGVIRPVNTNTVREIVA